MLTVRKTNYRALVRLVLAVVLIAALSFFYIICAEAKQKQTGPKASLNKTSLTMGSGMSEQLRLKNAPSEKITWRSTKKSVATVSEDGTVTAKKAGNCYVIATYNKKSYRCKIRVYANKMKYMPGMLKSQYSVKANQNKIVLAGSSSMERWKNYARDLAPFQAINVGIGGSKVTDWLKADLYKNLILRYKPSAIVFYIGRNDITVKRGAVKTAKDTIKLFSLIHKALPKVPIYYISIFPFLSPEWNKNETRKCNQIMEDYCNTMEYLNYIDVVPALTVEGEINRCLLVDIQHLNSEGYQIWGSIIGNRLREDLLTE